MPGLRTVGRQHRGVVVLTAAPFPVESERGHPSGGGFLNLPQARALTRAPQREQPSRSPPAQVGSGVKGEAWGTPSRALTRSTNQMASEPCSGTCPSVRPRGRSSERSSWARPSQRRRFTRRPPVHAGLLRSLLRSGFRIVPGWLAEDPNPGQPGPSGLQAVDSRGHRDEAP